MRENALTNIPFRSKYILLGVLRGLLFLSLGIPVLIFGLYGAIIIYYGKFKKNGQEGTGKGDGKVEFKPFVSVVVATHNEEMIISKKIENFLASNYPLERLEIIFVDDSDDSTPEIIQEYSKRSPNIQLIRFHERIGYSPSMIAGCTAAKGEIIVLSDAGSFLDAQAIPNLVARFRNPNIGVVTGNDVILNVNEEVGKSESLYLKIYNFLRTAETKMDSTFFVKGEATAVRKDLIKDLEMCSETFDTTVGLHGRQKGYRTVYDSQVKFYEHAPRTHSDRTKQKTIRAANLIKVLLRFRHMMFKREYGKYGCIVLPANFAMLVVAPLSILVGFVLLIGLTFFDLCFSTMVWGLLGLVFLFFLIFSRHLIFTFLEFEYSLLKALYQVFFTKKTHDKIEKVISTRRCQ
jgi:cellulose synthase/poly-beta-1,6-N-acetylglucosamine synthase-like glycosyltransferase